MPEKLRRVIPHGVMLGVSCWLYWASTLIDAQTGGRIGPAVWPRAVIVFMGLLCVYEIVKRLVVRSDFVARGFLAGTNAAPGQPVKAEDAEPHHHGMLAGGIALIAGYVVAVPWIGFFLATAIFLAVFPWIGGLRRPVISIAVGLGGAFVLAVVFMRVAYISLPLGEGPFRALSLGLMRMLGVT